MPIEDFIINVYCLVDANLAKITQGKPIRQRGFEPKLSDAEVLTMVIVGEFLGIDTDKGIWSYFKQHWEEWFPGLGSRSQFVRQSAALWSYVEKLWQMLGYELGGRRDTIHMVDGFPMHLCLFKRAARSRLFKGEASYGYCSAKGETYYGFKGHVMINLAGVISGITLTAADIDERDALWDLVDKLKGLLLGDKGYLRPELKQALAEQGLDLQTPLRSNMKDERPKGWVKLIVSVRRRIETVIGQLVERFNIEKIRARDTWHLLGRVYRKLLSHTVAIFFNRQLNREPLQFDGLITP
jgi:hypothetical protein